MRVSWLVRWDGYGRLVRSFGSRDEPDGCYEDGSEEDEEDETACHDWCVEG